MLLLRARVDLGAMAERGTLHSTKLLLYWTEMLRVINRVLVGGGDGGLTLL